MTTTLYQSCDSTECIKAHNNGKTKGANIEIPLRLHELDRENRFYTCLTCGKITNI